MKTFLYNFFPIYQNVGQTLSKKQRKASEKDRENYQDLSEEKKNKRVNMFGNGIEVSLKKKTEIDNMAESDIKVYLKIKNKG